MRNEDITKKFAEVYYFSVAVIKHHDQHREEKERVIWAGGSRRTRIHNDGTQMADMAAVAESSFGF